MNFMQFWFMTNMVLTDRGQPALTYGPARDLWSIYREKNWALETGYDGAPGASLRYTRNEKMKATRAAYLLPPDSVADCMTLRY